MEATESEAVFNSLNLNPQLFINEVLNTVDDLVNDAFKYYHQQASSNLKIDATDRNSRSLDLTTGVALIHKMIISVLDKRLAMWEQYCLSHCFEVPEGLSLRKTGEPSSHSSSCQDALSDPDLDARLDSLRSKLSMVGKESAALNRELRALEQQSVPSGHFAGLIKEALQLYEENYFDGMFQEMAKTVSELKAKMGKLKTRKMEETEQMRTERLHTLSRDSATLDHNSGFSDSKLEDLQEFLAEMKKM
ncbi:Centromere protein Mis [Trema orientale]|uniref:Centromere protein Mis n=1 Tax=Trema orientale TaxID=63057 RepID=A0A2P5F4I7_TREOI|nr:Centromere protein Mis [Trema orientale]